MSHSRVARGGGVGVLVLQAERGGGGVVLDREVSRSQLLTFQADPDLCLSVTDLSSC